MSCLNIFPVFLIHEKDDGPGSYLGIQNCNGSQGTYQSYSSSLAWSCSDTWPYNYGSSNTLYTTKAKGKYSIAGVDDYGNIFIQATWSQQGNTNNHSTQSKLFCCDGQDGCVEGSESENFRQQEAYTVNVGKWNPCYRWPNGYRGTYSTYLARSNSNTSVQVSNPCGTGGSSGSSACSRDLSRWPANTLGGCAEGMGGFGPGQCGNSTYVTNDGTCTNTFFGISSSKLDAEAFYQKWMKKSAEKILEIKEQNNKKNCCPGSGFPMPCNRDVDWYCYPYSRKPFMAPEESDFVEEFLDGNCWQEISLTNSIEVKNPTKDNFFRKMQAFQFNAAVNMADLDEYELKAIDSVQGQLIIYTPDSNNAPDDPEAPTPCCNECECFAGKILKTYEFNFEKPKIQKSQACGYGRCEKVETRIIASISNDPLYNADLYSNYYSQLNQEWDDSSPPFKIKACIKIA